METNEKEPIMTAYDPKGREVILWRYKTKFRVEKETTGYKSSFSGQDLAEERFQEQCDNSN